MVGVRGGEDDVRTEGGRVEWKVGIGEERRGDERSGRGKKWNGMKW